MVKLTLMSGRELYVRPERVAMVYQSDDPAKDGTTVVVDDGGQTTCSVRETPAEVAKLVRGSATVADLIAGGVNQFGWTKPAPEKTGGG